MFIFKLKNGMIDRPEFFFPNFDYRNTNSFCVSASFENHINISPIATRQNHVGNELVNFDLVTKSK